MKLTPRRLRLLHLVRDQLVHTRDHPHRLVTGTDGTERDVTARVTEAVDAGWVRPSAWDPDYHLTREGRFLIARSALADIIEMRRAYAAAVETHIQGTAATPGAADSALDALRRACARARLCLALTCTRMGFPFCERHCPACDDNHPHDDEMDVNRP